jgi:hypothetical protein
LFFYGGIKKISDAARTYYSDRAPSILALRKVIQRFQRR